MSVGTFMYSVELVSLPAVRRCTHLPVDAVLKAGVVSRSSEHGQLQNKP